MCRMSEVRIFVGISNLFWKTLTSKPISMLAEKCRLKLRCDKSVSCGVFICLLSLACIIPNGAAFFLALKNPVDAAPQKDNQKLI